MVKLQAGATGCSKKTADYGLGMGGESKFE